MEGWKMHDNNRVTRETFLKQCAAMGLAGAVASGAWGQTPAAPSKDPIDAKKEIMWAYLIHLGLNMWCDRDAPEAGEYSCAKPYLRFEDAFWKDLVEKMKAEGVNVVVIDLGEGVQYKSHPEIAVKGSWSHDRLREELAALRALGIEPLPKMNFSTCHDAWLGPYSHKVSTEEYYAVVRDLIAEAVDLFDKPRFFHLGMDEETMDCQKFYEYAQVRQYDLWWRDFDLLVKAVEKGGVRPWIWADCCWYKPDEFTDKMPKSVLQSSWFYGEDLREDSESCAVKAYMQLDKLGYDQVPTGSNWTTPTNFEHTVDYCAKRISKEHLKGFLQTSWRATLETFRKQHFEALEQLGRAKKAYSDQVSKPA
jgi:hypothetical protein